MKKLTVLRELPGTLYSAVVMELFERLAYYGMVLVLGIYMVENLGIRADTFGVIYGVFTAALYFLPIVAGALADRFGYKRALVVAFSTLAAGYTLLGFTTDVAVICVALGLIAVGGSIIKPTISGTVTRTTEEGSTRPLGFGFFYMMVSAGSLIGPVIAAQVRNRGEFHYVFWVSATACGLMLIQAVVAFRDPVTDEQKASGKSLGTVFAEVLVVLANWRFVLLLVIFSGYWGMMNMLVGFLPIYVSEFSNLAAAEVAIDRIIPITIWAGHWFNPEVFVALAALNVVLMQAVVSYLTRRWPTLRALIVGAALGSLTWLFPMTSPAVLVVLLGIMVWSLGETTCSARFFQYCGTIAPPDRVAVYLGYSFLSMFLGNLYSGPLAGWLYQRYIKEPMEAGLDPSPVPFFSGGMMMGVVTAIGLVLYARYIAPSARVATQPGESQ
jgi:POT family proton-dependent oligopeptide transporter